MAVIIMANLMLTLIIFTIKLMSLIQKTQGCLVN